MRVFVEVRSIREDHSCCDGGMLFRADFTMLLFPCLWAHARWCAIISKHRRHIVEFCALSWGRGILIYVTHFCTTREPKNLRLGGNRTRFPHERMYLLHEHGFLGSRIVQKLATKSHTSDPRLLCAGWFVEADCDCH